MGAHDMIAPQVRGQMPVPPSNVAVLVGNGLSMAFNPDLNLQSITTEVLERMKNADGDDVVAAMKEIAERALPQGVTSAEDFELLVGAFGAESRTLGLLDTLAGLTIPADLELRRAIRRVAEFAEHVREAGVSHVLEVIAERSHAYEDDAEPLHLLVESIIGAFEGKVTFGNLNYDTLLLAALLAVCQSDLADLGHGWKQVTVTFGEEAKMSVQALRESAGDFPVARRVSLLHLHGSLTYWGSRTPRVHAKLPTVLLRGSALWKAVRERTTEIRPVVVLASQRDKTEHASQYPFNLAYEMFDRGLKDADRWLVIGYSFRDDPVNAMLRAEFLDRLDKPRILVVTFGDELEREVVERTFGWGVEHGSSDSWLTIYRGGAYGVQDSPEWSAFIAH